MSPYLIDTHCHLDFDDFDSDRDEVIRRAYDGGVKKIVNIGCNLKRAKKTLEIADDYDFIFAGVGLHPQEAGAGDEKFFWELEKLLKEPKVIAIGECGLEFSKEGAKDSKQKDVFLRHLEMAKRLNKPVIIHCRNAYPQMLDILKIEKKRNSSLRGVVHFFGGRLSQAEEFLKLGFSISFTGVITFARDYDKIIKAVPLEKIMIETDAPFVSPTPYRGKRNEPLYVKYVAQKIAELKRLDFEEVAIAASKNAENLFGV